MDLQSLNQITTLILVIIAALGGGIMAKIFRLPLLLGYIAGGLLIGNLFNKGLNTPLITLVSDIGVTLLLFTLGVEFSFHRLKNILGAVTWPATIQIILTTLFFIALLSALSFPFLSSFFLGVAISLSSTAIITKFLAERGELETHHGELATGWLVVQDLAVIPMMIILPSLAGSSGRVPLNLLVMALNIALSMVKAVALVLVVVMLGRHLIPKLLNFFARLKNRELFLISTIGIVFISSILSWALGLTAALGAFIAGLLVAETSQNHAIFAEIRPLRDIFVVIFFVSLGMILPFASIVSSLPLLLIISPLVVIVKWGLVFILTRALGYHRKAAFLVGIYLIPMSEFGFIIAKEGLTIQALTYDQYIFVVSLTFITLLFSTIISIKSQPLYLWFNKIFGRYLPKLISDYSEQTTAAEELPFENHVVICGYGRVGKYIGRALEMAKVPYLVVDYNHTTVKELREKGVQVVYGDPADKDVLDVAQVDHAKAIVIAIPDRHTQELVIGHAQSLNRKIRMICRTHHEEDQARLKSLGVQTIVQPEFEAAVSIVEKLLSDFGVSEEDISGKVSRLKLEHGLG